MIFVHSLIRQKALGALSTVLFISGAGAMHGAYAAFPEQASLLWIWLNRFRMVFVWGNNCVWIKLPATAATTQHSSFPVMCHVSFRPQTQPQTGSFVVALVTALPAKDKTLNQGRNLHFIDLLPWLCFACVYVLGCMFSFCIADDFLG